MVSQLHEDLIDLFRSRPELAYMLLRDAFAVPVAVPSQIRPAESGLTEIRPPEYAADLVLVGDGGAAVILEVQLQNDEEKPWTWPMYLVGLRARLRQPVYLLVLTPYSAVATWAETTIPLGHPGFDLTPLVLGPKTIPAITDPTQAAAFPELAVLSAVAHGKNRTLKKALSVGHAALVAVSRMDDAYARRYADLIFANLSRMARKALEKHIMDKPYEYQSDFAKRYFGQGIEKGREEGRERLVSALLSVLSARGFAVDGVARQRIEECKDLDVLQRWLVRAATAAALAEVWADG